MKKLLNLRNISKKSIEPKKDDKVVLIVLDRQIKEFEEEKNDQFKLFVKIENNFFFFKHWRI